MVYFLMYAFMTRLKEPGLTGKIIMQKNYWQKNLAGNYEMSELIISSFLITISFVSAA